MEEIRLCAHCKKNHAARCYEYRQKGELQREFYCLECYSHLFLDEAVEENPLHECPYCGTTLSEVKTGKLVGCAHCYASMRTGIFPLIAKMQGSTRAHTGKTPPLDREYGDPYDFEDTVGAEYRAKAMEQARYERQCRELQTIIDKLHEAGEHEGAKCYEEKLRAMQNRSAIEEEFVWRTRRSLSKQS